MHALVARVLQQSIRTEGKALIFVRTLAGTSGRSREIWGSPAKYARQDRCEPSFQFRVEEKESTPRQLNSATVLSSQDSLRSEKLTTSANWASGKRQCISTAHGHCYLTLEFRGQVTVDAHIRRFARHPGCYFRLAYRNSRLTAPNMHSYKMLQRRCLPATPTSSGSPETHHQLSPIHDIRGQ